MILRTEVVKLQGYRTWPFFTVAILRFFLQSNPLTSRKRDCNTPNRLLTFLTRFVNLLPFSHEIFNHDKLGKWLPSIVNLAGENTPKNYQELKNNTNSENGHLVFSIFKKKQENNGVMIFRLYSKDIIKPLE